jgi:hypothetical protein
MKTQCLALLFLGLLASCALAQDNTVTVTKATETVPTTQIVGSTATVCPRSTRTRRPTPPYSRFQLQGTVAQPVLTLSTSSASALSPFWML